VFVPGKATSFKGMLFCGRFFPSKFYAIYLFIAAPYRLQL
jgi:hypothetical protein